MLSTTPGVDLHHLYMQLGFSVAGEASVAVSICDVASRCCQQKLFSLFADDAKAVAKYL